VSERCSLAYLNAECWLASSAILASFHGRREVEGCLVLINSLQKNGLSFSRLDRDGDSGTIRFIKLEPIKLIEFDIFLNHLVAFIDDANLAIKRFIGFGLHNFHRSFS
jgi:hypothetical protein